MARAGQPAAGEVLIIGGGIAGPTLGLMLHQAGIACRLFESAPTVKPVGVGINILPHASSELAKLGLEAALTETAVLTSEGCFFNRFGQLIFREPAGRSAGYAHPQYSIHRGDLQLLLLDTFVARAGADRLVTGARCTRVDQDANGVTVHLEDPEGRPLPPAQGSLAIGCDGIHSAIRRQQYPNETAVRYSGVNMWRGVTRRKPFLTGSSMVRAGWLTTGKMVIYPIKNAIDDVGNQLINWVAEIETPKYRQRDWNRPGRLEDFFPCFADWHFDWLDVAELIQTADLVLEFPMVDQDPLPRWSFGRITLLGDAAHPMLPRGSNGAGQAILDCRALTDAVLRHGTTEEALKTYEEERLGPTSEVVLTNRTNPPDAILRTVFERTGDRPFDRIEDVISPAELAALSEGYKRIAGFEVPKKP